MERLRSTLRRIDGRGYPAYKDTRGSYDGDGLTLHIDHVQGDPFAAPSRVALTVPGPVAGLPDDLTVQRTRRVAAADQLLRAVAAAIPAIFQEHRGGHGGRGGRGSGGSGRVSIDTPGQEILERTACLIDARTGDIEIRLRVGLPAAGRRVLGREAATLLLDQLPELARRTLWADAMDLAALRRAADVAEDAHALRAALDARGLVAFVAQGAILPRASGVDDRPLAPAQGAVPFGPVPDPLAVTIDLPHAGPVRGLGLPAGVTLVVGGGYHGKSTLLDALARGIYDHVPGDGRERVVTTGQAITVRAEDGRRVAATSIDPFIRDLPTGADTRAFSTERASGSTSQAAGIVEAVEAGATLLLVDEDTSANNFLVRDHRMQLLVAPGKEPITPFVDRVRQLHDELGVSTVLVLGGSSDYFEVADHVLQMDGYRPVDVTQRVHQLVADHPSERVREADDAPLHVAARAPLAASVDARTGGGGGGRGGRGGGGRRRERVRALETRAIRFGDEEIDLSLLNQLVDPSQTRALGDALRLVGGELADGRRTMRELAQELDRRAAEGGLTAYSERGFGDRAQVRGLDLVLALNRLRTLQVRQVRPLGAVDGDGSPRATRS